MPLSKKRKIKDVNNPRYNKNATPRVTTREVPIGRNQFGHIKWGKVPVIRCSHTTPVVRTAENDAHKNPARLRAAKTKAFHASNRPNNDG